MMRNFLRPTKVTWLFFIPPMLLLVLMCFEDAFLGEFRLSAPFEILEVLLFFFYIISSLPALFFKRVGFNVGRTSEGIILSGIPLLNKLGWFLIVLTDSIIFYIFASLCSLLFYTYCGKGNKFK